ncbi:MAG: response regulator [Bacteroidota bacterium]
MKKITLIDDENNLRDSISEILTEEGFNVTTARNGREGLAAVRETSPDAIICDVMMPVMDGFGVLKEVRSDENLRHTPFLFLTAKSDVSDVTAGLEAGVDGYVLKPVDIDDLLELLAIHLD